MFNWLTAGESHGPALTAIVQGLPAGVTLTTDDIRAGLARRRLGYGRGARQKFETDEVQVLGGLRHGRTLGSPLAIEIGNPEWPKWTEVMAVDPVQSSGADAGVGDELEIARNRPLTRPRPGHADLAGMTKYGFAEARPVLERASARETAARVALGVAAKQFLKQAAGIDVFSHVVAIGQEEVAADAPTPNAADLPRIDADPVRCADPAASERMVVAIDVAKKSADTLGGVVEVVAENVPVGLGSYVDWSRKLDARLAAALMSINAIKGVEVGDGFATARRPGSRAHDEIVPAEDPAATKDPAATEDPAATTATHQASPPTQANRSIARVTNRAGGIEGGMSNGEPIRVRAAMKPISTIPRALRTIDLATGEPAKANHQRSDVCAVPAAGVVAEAMVALVLADALIEKFGGDSVAETARNLASYQQASPW